MSDWQRMVEIIGVLRHLSIFDSFLPHFMTHLLEVTCPFCFQVFGIASPAFEELPCDLDYDCEICCRPMRIAIEIDDVTDEPMAEAYSLAD